MAAATRREYELFHDLAWRTVQTAPPKNPDAMLLLARAQALSGRPHDALVMIQRLAEMGVGVDVGSDDFARTRELPGWPAVAMLFVKTAGTPGTSAAAPPPAAPAVMPVTPAAPPAPAGPAAPARAAAASAPPVSPSAAAGASRSASSRLEKAPAAAAEVRAPAATTATTATSGISERATPARTAAPVPLPVQPGVRSDAARFTAPGFAPGGLAYDTVSRRFVIGDALTRKLVVVGLNSEHSTDMVRAESAGFAEVAAVEIDDRRGDLWVAGANGALHRLQLVSGRPLRTYQPAPAVGAARIADLAVAPSGNVIALDGDGGRLLTLARGAEALTVTMPLMVNEPRALVLDDEGSGFIASADGLARLDLRARSATPMSVPEGLDLSGIARLRWHRGTLIALQRTGDTARIVRIDINAAARRVVKATVIATDGPAVDRPFLAVDGDDLYFVTRDGDTGAAGVPYVIRRLSLR